MVRAILLGAKTQTRRKVKPAHQEAIEFCGGGADEEPPTVDSIMLSYGDTTDDDGKASGAQWRLRSADYPEEGCIPLGQAFGAIGDELWVRETWAWPGEEEVIYRADPQAQAMVDAWKKDPNFSQVRWMPSIFMPRQHSRIRLRIIGVDLEPLHDISQEDAVAEGCDDTRDMTPAPGRIFYAEGPRGAYAALWDQINGAGAWAQNPWVWALTFQRVAP